MNTIRDMETYGFSQFKHIEDERKRGAQINAVRYIKDLASQTRTDVSDWDLFKIFGDELPTDRKKINRVFFSFKEKAPLRTYAVDDSLITKFRLLEKKARVTSTDDLKRRRENSLRSAGSSYSLFLDYVKQAAKYNKQMETLQGYVRDYAKEMGDILRDGFWKLDDVTDSYVHMSTVNDIILTHINEKHGVLRTVNLGRFSFRIYVAEASTSVYPLSGSPVFGMSYPHPHVTGDRVCFGELDTDAKLALASSNIAQIADLARLALTSYNPESAYITLEELELRINKFNEERINGPKKQEEPEEEPEEQEHEDVEF